MLDELLGRAALKARIEELEDEKESLRRQYESAEESRSEAVSARQEAEARINRMEDRITELQDRVERLQTDEAELAYRGRESLRGGRLDEVLARLRSVETGAEGALTALVADGLPETVSEAFGDRAPLVRRAAPCLALTDDAGLVSAVLAPPRPPEPFVEWGEGFRLEERWFRPTGPLTFALVRSDLFALGEYDGSEFRSAAGFESDVKSKHSKGGFSQARFERRREHQIDEHLDRCRDAIAERDPETLVLVGDRASIDELADLADHTATTDASGDPEEALSTAFREFWTTDLWLV
ncbi:MAG: Vms1/Ankzf1 family peptidyl-tRNA hydrolase [Haloferacaceae archaeon]